MYKTLVELKCGVCGKTFIPAPEHIYKSAVDGSCVCSWHCMLESEKMKGNKRIYTMYTRRKKNEKAD